MSLHTRLLHLGDRETSPYSPLNRGTNPYSVHLACLVAVPNLGHGESFALICNRRSSRYSPHEKTTIVSQTHIHRWQNNWQATLRLAASWGKPVFRPALTLGKPRSTSSMLPAAECRLRPQHFGTDVAVRAATARDLELLQPPSLNRILAVGHAPHSRYRRQWQPRTRADCGGCPRGGKKRRACFPPQARPEAVQSISLRVHWR